VKTLTVDNGKQFADHQATDQSLGILTNSADPYCSWQRGSNENFNVFFVNTFQRSGAWKLSTMKS
jgi:IS30 family transposase